MLLNPMPMNDSLVKSAKKSDGCADGGQQQSNGMRALAPGYSPNEYDVICARGNIAKKHSGNIRFRGIIGEQFREYDSAATKIDKSVIVLNILRDIQAKTPDGGFIKMIDGQWYSVGDNSAREKIGQSLRDHLHTKYSSSTQAKKRRRQMNAEKSDSRKTNASPPVPPPCLQQGNEQIDNHHAPSPSAETSSRRVSLPNPGTFLPTTAPNALVESLQEQNAKASRNGNQVEEPIPLSYIRGIHPRRSPFVDEVDSLIRDELLSDEEVSTAGNGNDMPAII